MPSVSKAGGKPIHQSKTAIRRLQQQGSAVGTPFALIKPGYYGLALDRRHSIRKNASIDNVVPDLVLQDILN